MFLLDTNVISEVVRPRPDGSVVRWLRERTSLELMLSVLSLGEIEKGVACLDVGARRRSLETWVRSELPKRFAGRLLPIDAAVAHAWGQLTGEARRIGRPLPVIDGLLLATAKVHQLSFVTRNEADCADRGVPVLNPWRPLP